MKEKNELLTYLGQLFSIQPEDLVRSEDLGKDLNFEMGLPFFRRSLKLFHDLSESNLDNIPYSVLSSLKNATKQAAERFEQIKVFTATDSNPISTRDSHVNYIRDQYDEWFKIISPVISFSIRKGTDFEALEREARETLIQMGATTDEIVKYGDKMRGEVESTLEKVRRAAADVGVAQHATHFAGESEFHKNESVKWLITTVALGIITVCWGLFSFKFHAVPVSNPPTTVELIESVASKLIVLSALYYVLVWSAKNYNAHRHNFIVNKHRQNALSTFETFIKAAGNDIDTKNAVLVQTTQCIFGQQVSGYISKEGDQESLKLIEIMRSVGTIGKGS